MRMLGTMTRLSVLALALTAAAPAQTVLLSENFDGSWSTTNPPAGWTIYMEEVDTSSNDWHKARTYPPDPWPDNATGYALLDSSPAENSNDDSLVTPAMDCSGYNLVVLRCSTYFEGRPLPYQAELMCSANGGAWTTVFDYNGRLIGPTLQVIPIPMAAGQPNVRLAWVFGGTNLGISFWCLDNVTVIGDNVTDDVGVAAIVAPVDSTDSGTVITPRVYVKNFGPDPATFPVVMRIGFSYVDTVEVSNLPGGDSLAVDFQDWTAAPRSLSPVTAFTTLLGDVDPGNDTTTGSVYVRVRDVGPSTIYAPGDTVDSGATIQPQASIVNSGTEPATFYAFMRIGSWVDSVLVDDIAAGDQRDVGFGLWTAAGYGLTTARCSTGWVDDRNPANDTVGREFFIRPPNYKDVAAVAILRPTGSIRESVSVSPVGVISSYCAEPQTAMAYLEIVGEGGTVYLDSQPRFLQPGQVDSGVTFVSWLAAPQGQYTARLRASISGDRVPENDTTTGQFEVVTGLHDVGAMAIVEPADTVPAGPVTPSAWIRNYGSFLESFTVHLRIAVSGATVYYDSVMVMLNVDDSTLASFPTWNAYEGSFTARCSCALAGDPNPGNDFVDNTFAVESISIPPGWKEMTPVPLLPSGKDVKDGGWLAYDAGFRRIFCAKGNKRPDFYSYDPTGDDWTELETIPLGVENKRPSKGAAGCTDGNGTFWATKGNNTFGFFTYSAAGNSWQQLKDVPLGPSGKKVKGGTGIVYALSNGVAYQYLLKGYKNEFYRYHADGDSWRELPAAPVGASEKYDKGSWIVYDGQNTIYAFKAKKNELYAYNTDTDAWYDTLKPMPFEGPNGNKKAGDGGCATWYDNSIYALKGNNTQEFLKYSVTLDDWSPVDTIPRYGSSGRSKKVKAGAGIVSLGGDVFYMTKGNKSRELWRYRIPGGTGIREEYSGLMPIPESDRLKVRPNPVGSLATIELAAGLPASATVRVYNACGAVVLERRSVWPLALDCSRLPPGVYVVSVGGRSARFVKE
jgi:hypothetical protein